MGSAEQRALAAAAADIFVALAEAQGHPVVVSQRGRRALRLHCATGSARIESLLVAIADAMKR